MERGALKKDSFVRVCVSHTVQKTKFVDFPILLQAGSYPITQTDSVTLPDLRGILQTDSLVILPK